MRGSLDTLLSLCSPCLFILYLFLYLCTIDLFTCTGMNIYICIHAYICSTCFYSLLLMHFIKYIESNDDIGVQLLACVRNIADSGSG